MVQVYVVILNGIKLMSLKQEVHVVKHTQSAKKIKSIQNKTNFEKKSVWGRFVHKTLMMDEADAALRSDPQVFVQQEYDM